MATLFFLVCIPSVFGLATEHFGNAPVAAGMGLNDDALKAVNLPTRVYWREINGDPHFYFRGNTEALNEALRRFSKLQGEVREVILLPGPGETSSLTENKRIPYDWYLHPPGGFSLHFAKEEKGTRVMTKYPTLTIHVTVGRPAAAVDEKQVARWIAELDSDTFTVREKAMQELEKLGNAAGGALRKALAAQPTAEKRRRVQTLLEKLEGIDLDQIELPAGVTVVDVKELLERYRQGLKSTDATIRGLATGSLGMLARYSDDVLPTLVEVLKTDKHEYVRRSVAGALSRLGRKAEVALPILKEGVKDSDVNVRSSFEQAVVAIEKAEAQPVKEEEIQKLRALLDQIAKFRKAHGEKADK